MISPSRNTAFGAVRRRIDEMRVDLPQPDSPTMPTISPLGMANEMPRRAFRGPRTVS
jgi:hypothetical protein